MASEIQLSTGHIVFVLGMHRSGTSLTAELLNVLGATLPAPLLELQESVNATGFWEDETVVEINEKILAGFNSSWYDLAAVGSYTLEGIDAKLLSTARDHVERYYRGANLSLLKDPRLCRLMFVWARIFEEANFSTSCIYVMRHPLEVAASLNKRDDIAVIHGVILWIIYTLESLSSFKHTSSMVLSYQSFFDDSKKVLDELSAGLSEAGCSVAPDLVDVAASKILVNERHHKFSDTYHGGAQDIVAYASDLYRFLIDTELAADDLYPKLEQYLSSWKLLSKQHQSLIMEINRATENIVQLNGALVELGGKHSHAQSVVSERDQQLHDLNSRFDELVAERDSLQDRIDLIRSTRVGRLGDWYSRKTSE